MPEKQSPSSCSCSVSVSRLGSIRGGGGAVCCCAIASASLSLPRACSSRVLRRWSSANEMDGAFALPCLARIVRCSFSVRIVGVAPSDSGTLDPSCQECSSAGDIPARDDGKDRPNREEDSEPDSEGVVDVDEVACLSDGRLPKMDDVPEAEADDEDEKDLSILPPRDWFCCGCFLTLLRLAIPAKGSVEPESISLPFCRSLPVLPKRPARPMRGVLLPVLALLSSGRPFSSCSSSSSSSHLL